MNRVEEGVAVVQIWLANSQSALVTVMAENDEYRSYLGVE